MIFMAGAEVVSLVLAATLRAMTSALGSSPQRAAQALYRGLQ
jgi:hypothetical protein